MRIVLIQKRILISYYKKDELILLDKFALFLFLETKCRGPPVAQVCKFELIGGFFVIVNNKIEDDIVLAKFINYMKKALFHKKLNYIRDKNRITRQECSINKLDNHYQFNEDSKLEILNILNNKEIIVLKLHILEKRTYLEISKILNLKPENIRKIQYRAIQKIKNRRKNNNEN